MQYTCAALLVTLLVSVGSVVAYGLRYIRRGVTGHVLLMM
jgi:hypothetical protein